jgi:hypothetical protein
MARLMPVRVSMSLSYARYNRTVGYGLSEYRHSCLCYCATGVSRAQACCSSRRARCGGVRSANQSSVVDCRFVDLTQRWGRYPCALKPKGSLDPSVSQRSGPGRPIQGRTLIYKFTHSAILVRKGQEPHGGRLFVGPGLSHAFAGVGLGLSRSGDSWNFPSLAFLTRLSGLLGHGVLSGCDGSRGRTYFARVNLYRWVC